MSSGRLSLSKSVLQLFVVGSTAAVAACSPADVTIVLVYEGMGRYAAAAQASPEPDLAALFQEHVVEPIWARPPASTGECGRDTMLRRSRER